MIHKAIERNSIKQAANQILEDYLSNTTDTSYYRGGENIIYFDGWDGLGASAVLVAVAKSARSARSKFDIVIHVDCSVWKSRREMQRRIAVELKLDRSAMALFDKQDEDDDFSGIDKSSRAEIAAVAELIFQTVKDRMCLLIFHNGSENEINLAASGVPVFDWRNKVLWTFRGRFRLDPTIRGKVKSAHVFLSARHIYLLSMPYFVHEEASQIIDDINPTISTDCWFYLSHLHYNMDNLIDYDQDGHAANYWVCDGIIQGDSAWEIGNRLHEAMRLEYLPSKPNHSKWFDKFSDLQDKKTRWISIPSKSVQIHNIQTIPKETTSYFLTLEKSHHVTALPKHLFEQASKLRVLRLSWCTYSFASPPFIFCSNLRFILIDSCRDADFKLIGEGDDKEETEWSFLKRLWVLDIRHTSWDWILSPSKMVLMTELRELNLKSARASRFICHGTMLQLTWLCNLRKLRVIDSSTFLSAIVQDLFMGMEKLELLDLSGNSDMEVLPNLSAASILKVLVLDGCDGLLLVEPEALSTSLESFSFDGFGPASRWKNSLQIPEKEVRPSARHNQELPKVFKIFLENCARLKNVFLRGLPNLKNVFSRGLPNQKDVFLHGLPNPKDVFLGGLLNLKNVFSFYVFGPASRWNNSLKLPEKQVLPNARGNQELPKVSKISLEGCARLKNVFLRGLPNLEELNLSETSIEALDLQAMQVRQLERLFLIGCENLRRVQWLDASNPPLKLLCADTRGKAERSVDGDCQRSHFHSQQDFTHVVATDARFLRGFAVFGGNFHLHVSSTVSSRQLQVTKETEICSSDELGLVPAVGSSFPYVDVVDKVVKEDNSADWSMQACTEFLPSDRHIEFAKGGCNWEIKSDSKSMASVMDNAQSLHVHHNSSITAANLELQVERMFTNLIWCRVERCPKLHVAFLSDTRYISKVSFGRLENFWASDLLEARCIWSRDLGFYADAELFTAFSCLQTIHLHSCPRLVFVLPWSLPTLASLETIHITDCGDLRQIFPKGKLFLEELATNIEFPSLRNIYLHELPMLEDICETKMSAPALETIKLRGCWSLRRLPAIHAGRAHDQPPAVVDCEKDWWEELQWDNGLEASRHLFSPRHSRYYKKTIPRGPLLR